MRNEQKFGIGQIGNPTPDWAKLVFKIVVILTAAATIIISQTTLMTDNAKVEANVWLAALNSIVLGLSQMFGIEQVSSYKK